MVINKWAHRLLTKSHSFIKNPCIYIAASIGTLIGVLVGAPIGLFSGAFIGYSYKIGLGCASNLVPADPSITLGALIGLFLGGFLGGIVTGIITIYKIHKKTHQLRLVSAENSMGVILSSVYVGIEVAIGMGLGAVIGSLKSPGMGSLFGALIGITLILFTASLERKAGQ